MKAVMVITFKRKKDNFKQPLVPTYSSKKKKKNLDLLFRYLSTRIPNKLWIFKAEVGLLGRYLLSDHYDSVFSEWSLLFLYKKIRVRLFKTKDVVGSRFVKIEKH